MNNSSIIKRTEEYVKKELEREGSGHDWWHAYRVWKMARYIGKKEKANMLIVELASLLHDISDWKLNGGDDSVGAEIARKWLEGLKVNKNIIEEIHYIILNLSYKGGTNKTKMKSIEGKIVQDADRLDAIGAIGIARAFTFGGYFKGKMHDPSIKPMKFKDFEHFKKTMKQNTVINHFYEKLLKLKGSMNTQTAKEIAQDRHFYMENFLKKFYKEWEGKE